MKKKLPARALALALLLCGILAASAASQSEALVSLSHLNGIFWEDLKAVVRMETVRDTTAFYQAIEEQARPGGAGGGGFTAQSGVSGDVLSGSVGSGLIWTSGSGFVQSGALVDATAGSELAVGGALTAGHRYLAGTDVTLAVISAAQWMAEGTWTAASGGPVQPPAALPFADVEEGAWYRADVAFVYQNGLFNGESPTTFVPEGKMQRCMMTTVLHRLAGEPAVGYSAIFQDVPPDQWYTAGTIWAGTQGVVSGVGGSMFDPFSNVTRQEIAVILHRYAGMMGRDVSASASLAGFRDAASVAPWGSEAISWAVGKGILNGSDGALLPDGAATRAEVAAMLHRFADWSAGQ